MAELDNDLLSTLSKKIDDQARFTRIVTVLCCLAVIGCVSYAISSVLYVLPDLVMAKVMSNMETLHTEWKVIEKFPVEKKTEAAK